MEAAVARCFGELGQHDLPEGLVIACTDTMVQVPPRLRDIWFPLGGGGPRICEVIRDDVLGGTSVLLLVINASELAELSLAHIALLQARRLRTRFHVVLLPLQLWLWGVRHTNLLEQTGITQHVNGIIDGEPTGFELALRVHTSCRQACQAHTHAVDKMALRAKLSWEHAQRSQLIEELLWEHVLRYLPGVDDTVDHLTGLLPGYQMGRRLRRGPRVSVFEAFPLPGVAARMAGGMVVKVVAKSTIRDVRTVRRIDYTWDLVQHLSRDFPHPNIARTFDVFHGATHLYLCMENSGSQTLGDWLQHVLSTPDKCVAAGQLFDLAEQLGAALGHLHERAGLCHRNLCPEAVRMPPPETVWGRLRTKLVGFSEATRWQPDILCYDACGRAPYAAPEARTPEAAEGYDAKPADMWSAGMVIYEAACAGVPDNVLWEGKVLHESAASKEAAAALEDPSLAEIHSLPGGGRATKAEWVILSIAEEVPVLRACEREMLRVLIHATARLLADDPQDRMTAGRLEYHLRGRPS